MPRTPDRTPGVSDEESIVFEATVPASQAGEQRYDGTKFSMVDAIGEFDPRGLGTTGAIGGLHCANDGVTPDEKIDIDPGFALSSDASLLIKVTSALECDITALGKDGLDVGSVAADTDYAQWVIADSSGVNNPASLLSLSFSTGGLTLPTGYDKARFVWPVRTDDTADILPAFQPKAEGRLRKTYWLETHQLQVGGTAATFTDTAISAATRIPPSAVNQQIDIRSTKLGNAAATSRVEVVPDGWNEAAGGSVWAAHSGLNANQDPTSQSTVWMPVGPSRLLRYRSLPIADASADIFVLGWEDSL